MVLYIVLRMNAVVGSGKLCDPHPWRRGIPSKHVRASVNYSDSMHSAPGRSRGKL